MIAKGNPKTSKIIILSLLLSAVLIRVTFILFLPQEVNKDAADYDRIAWNIATTFSMYPGSPADSREILGRTPVYPAFLAIIYKLGGHSYTLARIIQAILDVGMCFLLFLIAGNLGWGIKPSLMVFGLAAINPFTSAYVGALISEGLGTFLLVLSFYLFYLALKKKLITIYLFSGLLFGILTLCRPQFVLLFPMIFAILIIFWMKNSQTNYIIYSILVLIIALIPYLSVFGYFPYGSGLFSNHLFLAMSPIILILWFAVPGGPIANRVSHPTNIPSDQAAGIIVTAIFCVLTVLPWTYRNYHVSGKFIPLVSSLYPSGGGWYLSTLPIPFGKDPMEVDERWKRFLQAEGEEQGRLGKEMEEIGYQRLVNKPHYYLWLIFRRTIRLWNHGNLLYSYKLPRWIWGIFTGIVFVCYLLAFLGAWITRKQWRILFPLYIPFFYLTILCALNHVEARYSIEAFPIVCLFGGVGLSYLWFRYKGRNFSEEQVFS